MSKSNLDRFQPWSDLVLGRLLDSPWYDLVVSIGDPGLLMYMSGAALGIGGLALMFGLGTRIAAFVLFVTLVPITFVIHVAPDHVGPFLKNVAILGGLVHFFVRGSGAFGLDRRLAAPAG